MLDLLTQNEASDFSLPNLKKNQQTTNLQGTSCR